MAAARIHNRSVGRLIFSAGLRKDGERSFEVKSDILDNGPVVATLITPWVIVVIFDRPRLDALAAQIEAEEADECAPIWDEDGEFNADEYTLIGEAVV